ncbi:response regulator [Sphingomonas sp. MMS24-J13]|uniref:response regulator n=1 Tax=Sphingomonas sp. MMS24-J13 TaxID=3238686 RepID=UPI0038514026
MSVSPAARAGTILVVEDETLLRMMAVDMFEDAGFTVFEAKSGAEGAQILADNDSIGGLFTDVEMPGEVDGFELARIAHVSHPSVAIMVVSGRAAPQGHDLPPGAKFVGKPYDTQAVIGLFAGLMPEARFRS